MRNSGSAGRWESLESRAYLAASPVLLGDINQTNDQLAPQTAVDFGGFAYFAGRPSLADGYELFKTDGTKAGTVLVKDIHPTLGSEPENLTNVNGTLFFVADDGVTGRELWKSDGTAAGTVRVVDLNPGLANASPALLTNVNGVLYFTASDGGTTVLWRSDGTAAGTQKVTISGSSQTLGNARDLVAYNGSLLLAAGPSSSSRTLYRVDAGSSIATAVSGSPTNPIGLTLFNNAVYYSISGGSGGQGTSPGDLWKTDGTAAGTTLVRAFNSLSGSIDYATTGGLTVSGNRLYFFTGSILNGNYALWGGDGTNANTRQLLTGSDLGTWIDLQPVGTNSILFLHTTSANGNEPWVSDGTVVGTTLLKDLVPGPASPDWFSPVRLGSGQVLFTTGPTYGNPTQIWTTNGTVAGTAQQTTLNRVPGAAFPIGTLNGSALLAGVRFYGDGLLYRSDGTAAGTYEIPATLPGNGTSMVDSTSTGSVFATVGNAVYFAANDGITGVELWKSVNGGSPVRVTDLAPNGADSAPDNFVVTDDGSLYFTATTVSRGRRSIYRLAPGSSTPQMVWATGTAGWTMISNVTAVGNAIYFSLSGGTTGGSQLWSYKPSIGAPYAVIAGGLYLSSASTLQRAGDAWYFGAQPTNANGSYSPVQRLYALNRDGLLLTVTDIPTGTSSNNVISPIGAAGNLAYFTAYTAATGSELWRTDGTAAGTFMVADVAPGTGSSDLYVNPGNPNLGTEDGQFYFIANDAPGVFYRTDGSAGSLTAITGLSSAFQPVAIDGQVYVLGGSTRNAAVYRVQGSAATQVAIGGAGDAAFSPTTMFTAGGAVYLIGIGGDNARWELWRADASFADVQKVAVLGPRVSPLPTTSPLYAYYVVGRFAYGVTGSDLYLPMYTDATGIEPYRISLGTTGSISGVVFNDANANGTQDPSEAPVAGDTLYLDANLNGRLDPSEATTVATAFGYTFTGLTAGQYVVYRVATTDGRRQTSPFTDGPGGYGVALSAGGEVTSQNFGVTAKPPTAVAANATVPEGGQVTLDGSASSEAFGTIVKYEWDFNYDGATFDVDAASMKPLFDATSIDGPATRTVALRVTDANGLSAVTTATVNIVNVPPTGTFQTGGVSEFGNTTVFGWSNVKDPSPNDQNSLKYSYDFNNDGDFTDPGEVLNGAVSGGYAYSTPGVHTIHARLADKDGASIDQYALAVVRPPLDSFGGTIEAESGTFTGGTAKSTANAGYTGTGYADFAGLNSSATWSIPRNETTPATLTFRYANGGTTNRPLQIFVNGTSVGTLAFAPTGSWTTWATVSLPITQLAGTVTIKAVATTSAGGANVDSLTLTKTPPAWLTASPGASYTYTNGYLEVTSGVVTLTSDVGLMSPDVVLAINGSSAKVVANTSQHLGTLYFGMGGTFEMAAGSANLLRTARLHLGMWGRIDLNGSDMLIDSTAPENTDARSAIVAGRASPMLTGIGTSLAQSDAARSLVYANADAYQSIYGPAATFRGESLDNDFVVIKSSFAGDSNLDGRVDFNDFLRLQSNYGKAGRPTDGDTNFDGVVDFNDFLALQAAYGRTV